MPELIKNERSLGDDCMVSLEFHPVERTYTLLDQNDEAVMGLDDVVPSQLRSFCEDLLTCLDDDRTKYGMLPDQGIEDVLADGGPAAKASPEETVPGYANEQIF